VYFIERGRWCCARTRGAGLGALYVAWRRANRAGKERIVAEPLLLLRALLSTRTETADASSLHKDLTTLAAIAWRAHLGRARAAVAEVPQQPGAFVPGRDTTIQPCAIDAAPDNDDGQRRGFGHGARGVNAVAVRAARGLELR
jgi:hypothetical protein